MLQITLRVPYIVGAMISEQWNKVSYLNFRVKLCNINKLSYNRHVLPDTTNIENDIMPPPPTGNGPGPGLLDSPIGRFLLPIGGGSAEGAWTLHFHINLLYLLGLKNQFLRLSGV